MKTKNIFKIPIVVFLASTVGCSKVDFNSEQNSTSAPPSVVITHNGDKLITETFSSTSTASAAIDMVWIIDNSGSMQDKINHVKTNINAFVSSVSAQADLRMAYVSIHENNAGIGEYGFTPQLRNGDLQINQYVDSWGPLAIGALALCPAASSSLASQACLAVAARMDSATPAFLNSQLTFLDPLKNFFRPTAAKTFVFVTDDRSLPQGSAFTSEDFVSLYRLRFPNNTLRVFGFVGLGFTTSSCQVNTGDDYIRLASSTGGQSFNICDRDWAGHFSALSNNVVQLAKNRFTLGSANVKSLVEVFLDGSKLSQTDSLPKYSLQGNVVEIRADLLSDGRPHTIKISYLITN